MRLSVDVSKVIPEYLTLFLTSHDGRSRLIKNAKQAVNQASINQTDVLITEIPICSLTLQEKIVSHIESRLSICDKIEQTADESLAKAESLRQSILKKAFEGKL